MSTPIEATRGHLAVFAGATMGDGTRLIGIQAETVGGSPGLGAALLTPKQAVALALELLERAGDTRPHKIRRALYGIGFGGLLP